MSLSSLIPELKQFADALIREAAAAGLNPRVTSTLRTYAEQKRLYEKFIAGQSQYPAAVPGTSAHEFGWAFDMVVTPMEQLYAVGALWESWGGVWGGRFHDPVHFEYPGFQAPQVAAENGGFFGAAFDFATGFIPGYGELQILAQLATLYPGLSQNEYLRLLAEPHRLFTGREPVSAQR